MTPDGSGVAWCGPFEDGWGYKTDPGVHYRCLACGHVYQWRLGVGVSIKVGPCRAAIAGTATAVGGESEE